MKTQQKGMLKWSIIVLMVVFAFGVIAPVKGAVVAVPGIAFAKSLGGTSTDEGYSIQQTADGGYILTGSTTSNDGDVSGNHGLEDVWVMKLRPDGSLDWQKYLGGSNEDFGRSIRQTADGGYILTGITRSNDGDVSGNNGFYDIWVVKLHPDGSLDWQKCLGGIGADEGFSIQQTADGGYILTGSTSSNDGDVSGNHISPYPWQLADVWVVKLHPDGSLEWQKCLGGSVSDFGYSIQQTPDGGYILTGMAGYNNGDVSGFHGLEDVWVVKLHPDGSLDWQKCLGGIGADEGYSIQHTADGGYILTGITGSSDGDVSGNHGNYDVWVVKLHPDGSLDWQKCLGGIDYDGGHSIQQTTDGGFILTGITASNDGDVSGNHGGADVWVVKLRPDGSLDWQKCLGGIGADEGFSIQQTADGGYILTGSTSSNDGDVSGNHGGSDVWVVKLNEPPSFIIMEPFEGNRGETLPSVVILGNNFVTGVKVKFSRRDSPDFFLTVGEISPMSISGSMTIPENAVADAWDILIMNPDGGQVLVPEDFRVTAYNPSFGGITPSSGAVGATVPVTITGNFFVSGATVKFQRYGSPDMPLVIDMVTTTTITGTLSIPPGAATGEWFILITNPDGKSSVTPFGAFTVTSTGIKVTAITPNSGVVGSTVSINNLAGTGFVAGAAVKLTKGAASIPATSINVASPTKIKCNFAIPSDAVLGTYSVVVTNPGGTTSAQLTDGFTVTNTPPTVTSISPNTDVTGKTVDVTLTGTGFMPGVTGTTVTLSGNGPITYLGSNVVVSSPTTITCTIDLTGAKTGNYDVVVTNHDGQSGTLKNGFKVTLTGISVTGIKPSSGAIGTTISITNLAGTGFQAGATVQLTRAGAASITATNVVVASKTRIKCDFAIPSDAVLGTYNVVVTNPGGTSAELTNGFTVTNPPPTVSSISPSTGVTGTTVTITSLTGTGFMTGATVTLSGNGPIAYSAMNVVVSSSTTITCTIALTGAKTGTYNVVVTNTDGQLGVLMNGFKVTKK